MKMGTKTPAVILPPETLKKYTLLGTKYYQFAKFANLLKIFSLVLQFINKYITDMFDSPFDFDLSCDVFFRPDSVGVTSGPVLMEVVGDVVIVVVVVTVLAMVCLQLFVKLMSSMAI